MKYALDTNTLIYFFKGQGQVSQHLFAHSPQDVLIPSIVLYEIETGLAKSNQPLKHRQQLHELLQVVELAVFDRQAARAAATLRAALVLLPV